MGRNKIWKEGREEIGCYLHPEEMKAFEEIRWRERKGKTDIAREAVLEYIRNHANGNNTFKLTNWQENPEFQAIPTLLSKPETWYQYLQECSEQERLRIQIKTKHINDQCKNITTQ